MEENGAAPSPPVWTPPAGPAPPGPVRRPLNPWISIWTQPRATMRQILDTDPRRMVTALAVLNGLAGGLSLLTIPQIVTLVPPGALAAAGALFGPILGLISLYLGGWLVRLTGRWLEGTGDAVAVRAALAWSCVPALWTALLLALPQYLVIGRYEGDFDLSEALDNPGLLLLRLMLGGLRLVLAVWQVIIKMKCIGEAHRFSAWRALGAYILALLLVLAPIAVLALALAVPALLFHAW